MIQRYVQFQFLRRLWEQFLQQILCIIFQEDCFTCYVQLTDHISLFDCRRIGQYVYYKFLLTSLCQKLLKIASVAENCLRPESARLMSLSMLEHGWILLNVSEYAWKCLNKLTIPGFSICHDIVIIKLLLL